MKNVQLSMELFYSLLQYHLMENQDPEIKRKIKRELEAKLEKMVRHELYSTSKMAAAEEEREKARQEYLDRIGMNQDFRW